MLTIKQVAETLQMHPQTIRNYIIQGKLKATHLNKRVIRITQEDFDEFFNRERLPKTFDNS